MVLFTHFLNLFNILYGITISSNGIIYVSTYNGIISYWNDDNWKIITQTNKEINGLKIDSFNNLLFVESESNCIKKMNLNNGEISLFAGSEEGNKGNLDGLLLESRFNYPFDIIMNNSSIYISDCYNHTIRKISLLGLWNKGKKEKTSLFYFNFILFFNSFFSENHHLFPSLIKKEIITIMILSMKKNIHNNLNNKISNNHFIKLPNDILFIIFQFLTMDETYEG